MSRCGRIGVFGQVSHPRVRGGLSPESGSKNKGFWGATASELTEQYFVPSFSIRRHLHRSEEERWLNMRRQLGSALKGYHTVMPPSTMAIKSIEQKALIQKIRESGNQPTAQEMRDVVLNIKDGLTEALSSAPDPLEVGLGKLAIFGKRQDKVGFTIEGWKGWRARYALTDAYGEMTTHGALLVENQIALGGIGHALADTAFSASEITSNPHLTIVKSGDRIRERELRNIQKEVDKLGLQSVLVGDPVIDFRASARSDTETFYIRNSYDSLAVSA